MAATLEFRLRDGTEVLVRPIAAADAGVLREGFERLSEESRFRRFLAPTSKLSDNMVRYLTDVDHHDHEALIALDGEGGRGVGVARYVRTGPDVAEAAVTVADDWQGRGLGTALLELLAQRGREEGIVRFSALMLRANEDMLDLMRRLGPVALTDGGGGAVEVVAELPREGIDPHLHELLRMAARRDAEIGPSRA